MKYHNITKVDMLNGDVIRVCLWVSGCSHACPECHNPITWNANCGLDFDENAKQEIFAELEKCYVAGLTLTGGDPLFKLNEETVTELAKEVKVKYPNKTIWLYTGYTFEEIKDHEILKYVDVLVDGKYVKELRDVNLHWKGSSNQRVINVPKTLCTKSIVLHD